MFILLFFILGAIFGSFVNCMVYRIKNKKTILGRSFCPHCKHELSFLDLFPLFSYLLLGCRCRYCKKMISFQYFLVELVTAIIFAFGCYFYFGSFFATSFMSLMSYVFYLIMSLFLIFIFIYDFKYYLVLDEIIYPGIVIAFLFNLALGLSLWNLLLAGFIGFSFFALQYFLSKGKWVGGGDMFIGLFMGFVLGFPNILVAIFLAYFVGGIVAMFLLLFKGKKLSNKIPLGPFLTFATLLVYLYGKDILDWYLSFLYI